MKDNRGMYQVCVIQINSYENRQVARSIEEGREMWSSQHIHCWGWTTYTCSEISSYFIALFRYAAKLSIPLDN